MPGRNRQPRPPRGNLPSSSSTKPSSKPAHPTSSSSQPRPQNQNRPPRPPRANQHTHDVPPHAAIAPGTPVSIILKQDQPTGRQVTGFVADVLTRGDHHRGVKVRLRDGRVGRVQRIVEAWSVVEAAPGSGEGVRGGVTFGGTDVRDDPYLWDESNAGAGVGAAARTEGLFAALEEADARHQGLQQERREPEGEAVCCPVCQDWWGDERAVEVHVAAHFGEG